MENIWHHMSFSEKISELRKIRLETKLILLGVKSKDDIESIIDNGFNPDRVKNNPRLLTEETLREMLHRIR